MTLADHLFKRHRFDRLVMVLCVRWYCRWLQELEHGLPPVLARAMRFMTLGKWGKRSLRSYPV